MAKYIKSAGTPNHAGVLCFHFNVCTALSLLYHIAPFLPPSTGRRLFFTQTAGRQTEGLTAR